MSYPTGTDLKCTPGTVSGGVPPLVKTYQWELDGVEIVGATSITYTTEAEGELTCVETVTDDDSVVISAETLAVTIVPDTTAPTITNVTSAKTNGSYTVGEVIDIQIVFSEVVNVVTTGGTPTLELETGTTDRTASYNSGTGSNTLVFRYTVQTGDTAADLDYKATNSLALNSGTIKDAAGNDATLTLASPGAAGSLAANKALVIDTTVPTLSTATIAANGTTLTLVFSETVAIGAGGAGGMSVTGSTSGSVAATLGTPSGNTIVCTLASSIKIGETFTVSYTQPGNGIEDGAGNDLATVAGWNTSVTNNSEVAAGILDKTNLIVWLDLANSMTNQAYGDSGVAAAANARGTGTAYTTGPFADSNGALALVSSGSTSWADITGAAGLDPSADYSLALWFKDTNTGNTGTATLVQRWNFASGCSWRLARQTGSNDRLSMLHSNDGVNANQEVQYSDVGDYTGDSGNWIHIGWTYDSATSTGKFYVNGSLAATVTFTTETGTVFGPSTTTPLLLGTEDASNGAYVTNGAIARFSLWHRELSGAEMGVLYNAAADVKYADL